MNERFLLATEGTSGLRLALPEFGRIALELPLAPGPTPSAFLQLVLLLEPEASVLSGDDETTARALPIGERVALRDVELSLRREPIEEPRWPWVSAESWRRALARLPGSCALRVDGPVEPAQLAELLPLGPRFGLRAGRGLLLAFADEAQRTSAKVQLQEASRAEGLRLVITPLAQPADPGALEERAEAAVRLAHSDPKMLAVEAMIDRAAPSPANVVIVGESGTGKDLVAQEILRRSGRSSRAVRTSAVALLDAEVLQGNLRDAEGAVLIVDEITALDPRAQLALAHGLDAAEARGAAIRVLSLSSTPLSEAVGNGQFRKELAYRLEALSIGLPPLRQRRAEIAPLARHFAAELSTTITSEAIAALEAHDFPGNVRELKNLIGRAHLASGGPIDVAHLPTLSAAPDPVPATTGEARSLKERLAEMERLRIIEALRTHKTQREAALALEMPMSTFLARLDAYGIPRARGGGKKE